MRRWHTRIFICLALGAVTTVAVAWVFAARLRAVAPSTTPISIDNAPLEPSLLVRLDETNRLGSTVERATAGNPEQHWRDFVHYVWLARPGLAARYAEILLATTTPEELLWLVGEEPTRSEATLSRAALMPGLKTMTDTIKSRVEAAATSVEASGEPFGLERHYLGQDSGQFLRLSWRVGWPLRALHGELWRVWGDPGRPVGGSPGRRVWSSPGPIESVRHCLVLPNGLHKRIGVAALPRGILPLGFIVDSIVFGFLWWTLIVGIAGLKRAMRRRRGRCPMCKYDLRGDLDAGCPECGWGREEVKE